jgi:hypothetical protein
MKSLVGLGKEALACESLCDRGSVDDLTARRRYTNDLVPGLHRSDPLVRFERRATKPISTRRVVDHLQSGRRIVGKSNRKVTIQDIGQRPTSRQLISQAVQFLDGLLTLNRAKRQGCLNSWSSSVDCHADTLATT